MVVSANRLELLQIADAVAREKSIDRQQRQRHGHRSGLFPGQPVDRPNRAAILRLG